MRSRADCKRGGGGVGRASAGSALILPVDPASSLPVKSVLCTGTSAPESGLVVRVAQLRRAAQPRPLLRPG